MDAVMTRLQVYLADGQLQPYVIVALAAVTVFLFAFGLMSLIAAIANPVRRRLGALAADASESGNGAGKNVFAEWVQGRAEHILPSKNAERESVQRQLIHAGLRSPNALAVFYGVKTCLAVGLLVAMLIATRWAPRLSMSEIVFFALLAAGAGLIAPNIALRRLVERRQKLLRNAFPDALDMLVICVEAGLGLTAAIQRVADELRVSHPELAAELAMVNAETRAGVERETALRNLTDRTGLDDIRGLVSLLIQTLRFGTGIADTLRVYSEEFRDKRMQKAEELAAKIGTKLIFPLVFCLFPSFFVVAVGPAAIRIMGVFDELGRSVGN